MRTIKPYTKKGRPFIMRYVLVIQTKLPKGVIAVGIFLFFGAIMAPLAGTTLVWRGTILDRMWAIHAPAYRQLAPFGKTVGIPFLLLGATLAVAGTGWFLRRLWGWRRAVAIIATQVLGDLVSAFRGDLVRGLRRVHNCWDFARVSSMSKGQSCFCEWQCPERSLTKSSETGHSLNPRKPEPAQEQS